MSMRYNQGSNADSTRFTKTPISEVEYSRMTATPTWYVPFNGGDIVPVYYAEVLPHDTFAIDLDFVVRQTSASLRPTMGYLQLDIFAYFVPNRIINESWKNVQGENTSGYWAAPEVSLVPLTSKLAGTTKIPVGSIADYYGFPTQFPIYNNTLAQCNDLKFRGFLDIWNNYFRDQNYQNPIAFSKLNISNEFLEPKGTQLPNITAGTNVLADGSSPNGAIKLAIEGEGSPQGGSYSASNRPLSMWSALDKPLKANKLHDVFTSVLPSPQKGSEVTFNLSGELPVDFSFDTEAYQVGGGSPLALKFGGPGYQTWTGAKPAYLMDYIGEGTAYLGDYGNRNTTPIGLENSNLQGATGWNVLGTVDLADAVGVSINDLRTAVATQQVLELLARGGSRYWTFLKTFFGIEAQNPFPDIPTQIGHIRRELDLYQVAQTSASVEGDSPQGSLTAFGYTTKGGAMFTKTFLEHGYIHVLAVVRHKSIYSTYFAPDNFRRNTLDWYLPQFANIGEQPIRLAMLNPFRADSMERVIGYQEAWWDYRFEQDQTTGILRSGLDGSLDIWHYGNEVDVAFTHVNGDWLVSDTQVILDRSLAVTSELAPQFIGMFNWKVTKQRPLPIYSVPGLDII